MKMDVAVKGNQLFMLEVYRKVLRRGFLNHGFHKIKFAQQPNNKLLRYTRSKKDKLPIIGLRK